MSQIYKLQRGASIWQALIKQNATHATTILALVCVADMALTLFVVRTGMAHEANPMLKPFLDMGDGWFLFAKGFSFIAPLMIVELLRPKSPKFIKMALNLGAIAYPIVYLVGSLAVN